MAVDATISTQNQMLTYVPTNLKEAIDWVLRVTGRDEKSLKDEECICGLAEGGNSNIANLLSTVKGMHETKTVRGLIEGLAKFIGWNESSKTSGERNVDGSGIGQRDPSKKKEGYRSVYNNEKDTPYTWSKLNGGNPGIFIRVEGGIAATVWVDRCAGELPAAYV